jgi:hypothetical protein
MTAGITGALLMVLYVAGAKIGWSLMDRWLERREARRAAKLPPEKITVVKFTEAGN